MTKNRQLSDMLKYPYGMLLLHLLIKEKLERNELSIASTHNGTLCVSHHKFIFAKQLY